MFLSSKQIPKTYNISSALKSTGVLPFNLLEPGFYHWNPNCLELERRARLSATPNPPAKEQRELSPLCFPFQYMQGMVFHGLNAIFIISTLAHCWTKACIRLRIKLQVLGRRDGCRTNIKLSLKCSCLKFILGGVTQPLWLQTLLPAHL